MGPIWGRQDPGGPHVPMNFAIWEYNLHGLCWNGRLASVLIYLDDPDQLMFCSFFVSGDPKLADQLPNIVRINRWIHDGNERCAPHTMTRNWLCMFGIHMLRFLTNPYQLFVNKLWYAPDQILAYNCVEQRLFTRIRKEYCENPVVRLQNIDFYKNMSYTKNHVW